MKKIVFVALIFLALVACSKKEMGPKKEAQKGGPVLAKVGTADITQSDFEREMETLPDYAQQMFEGPGGKEKFLDEIIKKEILYQEALKKGIDKSPDFLKKLEEFKKLTLVSALLEKEIMSKSTVSDQEVKDYYEKNKADFAATSQIRASHILVKTEGEARKILERLKKGEKFDVVAKKESIDKESAKNGGDIGYFSKGQVVPEFEKVAAGLKKGEMSPVPVKTSFGYHIIKVTDRKTGPVIEFDRVKDIIRQRLSGEKQKDSFDSYVSELKKTAKIEVNKDALAKVSVDKEKKEKPEESSEKPEGAKEETKTKEEPKAEPKAGKK